jgi:hypothetical protein
VNANQKAKEDAAAKQVADQQKATNERRISTQQQALKGAITSTLGTQFGLDVPYKLGIKNEAPIDANAAPIGAMDNQPLSLGTPYENALRAKTSDLGAPRRSTGELSNELFKQGMNLLEAKLESVSKDYESEFNKLTGKSLNQLEEVMRSAVYDTDINTVRLYSPNEEDYLGVNRSRLKTEVIDRLKRIIKPEQSMGNTEEVARNFVEKLNPYIESYIDTVSYLNNATGSNASLLEATPYLKGGAGLSTPQRLAPIKTATDVIERANLAPIAPEMGKEGYNSTRQNLLYGSPLGGLTPSMGTTTNLSSSSTPDVTLSQNSERQISKLDDIKSILASIDRKTKIPSSSTSGKLEITIT